MTDQDILNTLSRILGILLGDDSMVLVPQTTRADVPRWDSFMNISFIVAVEAEFGIKFRLADVEAFQTVGEIVEEIRSLKGWQ
jgi:acyl carrier protein